MGNALSAGPVEPVELTLQMTAPQRLTVVTTTDAKVSSVLDVVANLVSGHGGQLLRMTFAETELGHETTVAAAGMCDGAEFQVTGLDELCKRVDEVRERSRRRAAWLCPACGRAVKAVTCLKLLAQKSPSGCYEGKFCYR
jgi:hypothetical protein